MSQPPQSQNQVKSQPPQTPVKPESPSPQAQDAREKQDRERYQLLLEINSALLQELCKLNEQGRGVKADESKGEKMAPEYKE